MQRKTLFLFFLLALLAGCATLAPNYSRPAAPVPTDWPGQGGETPATAGAAVAEIPWQDFFLDPQLRAVIATALEKNRDLRLALLNMERAQAEYRIRRADLLPALDGSAAGSVQRIPADLSASGDGEIVRQYSVGLGVSAFELDLFGRVRSLKEQALEEYLATSEARRSVEISLVASVARAYLNLAADREGLQLARETLENQQASYHLIERRFQAGVASALDLNQARSSLEAARVDIARYTSLVAQDENGLDLLVGARVAAPLLPATLSTDPAPFRTLAPGLPSTVLLARPDIRAAEHRLQGANANIGAARAAFFPRIELVSSIGTGSDQLSGLFGAGSLAWNFAPRLTLPLFNAGANRANLAVAKVDQQLAVARYEQAIQVAFREVADALAVRATIGEQAAAQQALTAATAESYRLSQARYARGIDSYLNVLDAHRSLYSARQNLIGVRLALLANQVTLYQVLGGGSSAAPL
ncbi:AdeC/AdeK/OprM family multidrug efflux complex outer membrane factor [Desulfuromonas carbonis]|uniref:efflux transporter outer membrane subunit n=1 Tax=Desulfuromonas sp. DDH964 TaxID=1823759 RepID=UPI00078E4AF3|nr:efflux transporter outer membrane subunit [Desulfuromonas sp. DDH964]AMV73729.1 RND family efflux pump outer membrane protein [Desulfuromonas sp. DDH964]